MTATATTATIWGTCNFRDRAAAIRYYRPQGYGAADIDRKASEGEIAFGPPAVKPGERLTLLDDRTRYGVIVPDGERRRDN
jgi:hypothetical protein